MLEEAKTELVHEIMLQINETLYIKGEISRELYEQAKIKIVERRKGWQKEWGRAAQRSSELPHI